MNCQSGEEITAFDSPGWVEYGDYDFSLDDQRLVIVGGNIAGKEGKVRCCNANNGSEYWQRQGLSSYMQYARFLRNDTQLLIGNRDLYLLDASTGKTFTVFKGHRDNVLTAATSDDGGLLVTGSMDNTARIWGANTGSAISELIGHTDAVCGVEFSKDNRRVVTASWDNSIRIWDLSTAANLSVITLKEHPWSASIKGDDELVVITDIGKSTWYRRRPEWWWGVAWLPEFWLTVLFTGALVWSFLRDRRELRKKTA